MAWLPLLPLFVTCVVECCSLPHVAAAVVRCSECVFVRSRCCCCTMLEELAVVVRRLLLAVRCCY